MSFYWEGDGHLIESYFYWHNTSIPKDTSKGVLLYNFNGMHPIYLILNTIYTNDFNKLLKCFRMFKLALSTVSTKFPAGRFWLGGYSTLYPQTQDTGLKVVYFYSINFVDIFYLIFNIEWFCCYKLLFSTTRLQVGMDTRDRDGEASVCL